MTHAPFEPSPDPDPETTRVLRLVLALQALKAGNLEASVAEADPANLDLA